MPAVTNKLTNIAVQKAAPKEDRPYKMSDGHGLFLLIKPSGAKYWRWSYRYAGKQKELALGTYPLISLKAARTARDDARRKLLDGVDPGGLRKLQKTMRIVATGNSFQAVALEWFSRQKPRWAEKHWVKVQWMLEKNLFPWLGTRPVSEITPPELLATLLRIEERGAIETAKRVKQVAGQVFRYAVATGRADRDPAQDLKGALTPPVKGHFAAVTEPEKVGPLLRMLDGYEGSPITRAALRLAPLTFVRPGERPANDVLPEDVIRKMRGQRGPQKEPTKVPVSIRLSPEVVKRFKASGPGWQARMDDALKQWIKEHQ